MNDIIEMLARDAKDYFVKDYVKNNPESVLAAETLGMQISFWADCDGEQIALFFIRAMCSGLEDANWHSEAKILYDWIDKMENGMSIEKILRGK